MVTEKYVVKVHMVLWYIMYGPVVRSWENLARLG